MSILYIAAFSGGTMTLLLCGYLGTSTLRAVTFLALSNAVLGLSIAGTSANTLDIAPRFAGVVQSITNIANTLPGVIGPLLAESIAIQVHRFCPSELSLLVHEITCSLLSI